MEPASQAILFSTPPYNDFLPSIASLQNATFNAYNLTATFLGFDSSDNLIRLPLRFVHKLDHVVFRTLPRYLLEATGLTEAGAEVGNIAVDAGGEVAAQVGADTASAWGTVLAEALQASTFKSYWGMLSYVTSRWAFTCFAVALILNRINVYGASRQRIVLSWNKRLALRLIPIMLFIPQIYRLLCGIHCQTSPEYSLYRHGDNNKYSTLDWSTDGGVLYTLTSRMLFSQSDAHSCAVVGMSRPKPDVRATHGSFSLLWPTFLRLTLSHLVESLSCSLQQIPLMTEVGMSVFEHSLAFAEAESLITSTLSILAREVRAASSATQATTSSPTASATPRSMVMASGTIMALSDAVSSLTTPHVLDRINVPVEVLLIALLSTSNALCSNILAVFGKQHKWRLVNTAIWGCLFMGSFVWGFSTTSSMSRFEEGDRRPVSSLLHFPTVAIIGFLPHMLILVGIIFCFIIYCMALSLTAFSLGSNPAIPHPTSLKQRFSIAHDNLTAAIQLRGIQIRWAEDFYTALLRIGFTALTAASEAVFLNEGRAVEMRQFTWLEEERLDEMQLARNKQATHNFQILEEYGIPSSGPGGADKGGVWESGYAKERKVEKKEGDLAGKDSFAYPTPRQDGVGAVQRTTRFYLLFIYIRGIVFLVSGWIAYGLGALLDRIGVTSRPRWLRRVVGASLKEASRERQRLNSDHALLDHPSWRDRRPDDLSMDVESEMQKNIARSYEGAEVDRALDESMYQWWKDGGWFGNKDASGDYQPSRVDEDTTSVLSMSTALSSNASQADDHDWLDEPEGVRTPTQASANTHTWSFADIDIRTRESTPLGSQIDTPLDPVTLARLLNPPDAASREEARILASHLNPNTSSRIMTRSQYRTQLERERARILLAGRHPLSSKHTSHNAPTTTGPAIPLYTTPSTSSTGPRPLTPAEEADALESLLLARRGRTSSSSVPADRRDDDPTGDNGAGGVLCVVCQTSPRTIIAWPCRCLCVCEDCRVSLAMNNFGNCVTCRRGVAGFVRLFVP